MAAKKRIGRPPKAKEDRKAVNFTFRSRGQMRERLQAAAIAAGRSISEEIEFRLERSFWQEEMERDTAKLQVRLPERLRRRLEQAAEHNKWSMNTEIFDRLDVSFQRENRKEMEAEAARGAVQAQQEVTKLLEQATRKLLAAELSKSNKHESPPKGEDSK
jgi:predicted HicB family RNase H-like nuclease